MPRRQRWFMIAAGVAVGLLILDRLVLTPLADHWKKRSAEIANLQRSIDVAGLHSPADQLLALLGFQSMDVDGPADRVSSTVSATSIPRDLFNKGREDAVDFIEAHKRLPSHVWFGNERLSLADFTATLAGDQGGPTVAVRRGMLAFEKYVATDPRRTFDWAIHPEGFEAPELLELARLQAWTIKPARLR